MPDDEKAAHIRAHDEILDQYTQPQLDQMSGKLLDRAPTISLIQQWLLDHLTTHDLKIREYVASSPTGQVETNDR
jgi:hemerythrin